MRLTEPFISIQWRDGDAELQMAGSLKCTEHLHLAYFIKRFGPMLPREGIAVSSMAAHQVPLQNSPLPVSLPCELSYRYSIKNEGFF